MKKILRVIFAFALTLNFISFFPLSKAFANVSNSISFTSNSTPGNETVFNILVKNADNKPHKFTLNVSNIDKKIPFNYFADDKVINEISLSSNDSKSVTLKVNIPKDYSEKIIYFNAFVKRDDGPTYTLPGSIVLDNVYSIKLTSQINNISVISGQSFELEMGVKNTGLKELNKVNLNIKAPYKWVVENLSSDNIKLKPGESYIFKTKIFVPQTQVSGSNVLKVQAISDNATSQFIEIPVLVKSNPNYFYIILILLFTSIIGTLIYFKKHGRR